MVATDHRELEFQVGARNESPPGLVGQRVKPVLHKPSGVCLDQLNDKVLPYSGLVWVEELHIYNTANTLPIKPKPLVRMRFIPRWLVICCV